MQQGVRVHCGRLRPRMRGIILLDQEENAYTPAYLYFLRNKGIVKL